MAAFSANATSLSTIFACLISGREQTRKVLKVLFLHYLLREAARDEVYFLAFGFEL
jgi:hypothetical protein